MPKAAKQSSSPQARAGVGDSWKCEDKAQEDAAKPIESLAKDYKTDLKKGLSSKKACSVYEW